MASDCVELDSCYEGFASIISIAVAVNCCSLGYRAVAKSVSARLSISTAGELATGSIAFWPFSGVGGTGQEIGSLCQGTTQQPCPGYIASQYESVASHSRATFGPSRTPGPDTRALLTEMQVQREKEGVV